MYHIQIVMASQQSTQKRIPLINRSHSDLELELAQLFDQASGGKAFLASYFVPKFQSATIKYTRRLMRRKQTIFNRLMCSLTARGTQVWS